MMTPGTSGTGDPRALTTVLRRLGAVALGRGRRPTGGPGLDSRQRLLRCLAVGYLVTGSTWFFGCGSVDPVPTASVERSDLLPVELPDVSGMHPSVQEQLRSAHRALEAIESDRKAGLPARSAAFGRLGMLLLAGDLLDAAEPGLRNALQLAPDEFRWMYYLGYLAQQQGDLPRAVRYFELAHRTQPDDVPVLVRLITAYLDLGRPEAAEPFLDRVRMLGPDSQVVRFQHGRAAASTQDYANAVEHFEAALRLDPTATIIHYPLAMAYRGLGNLERASHHLDRSGGTADGGFTGAVMMDLADPLLAELVTVLRSPGVHRQLALEADANGDRVEAARQFQMAVEMAPEDPDLRVSLAMAYERAGQGTAALNELEVAVRLDPQLAQAHFIMGRLSERGGRDEEALDHYRAAATYDPGSREAKLMFANALRRLGLVEASLVPYRQVLDLDADADEARFGEAMALVWLGRHREARERLALAARYHPGHPAFATALARLLAASPDAQVRNGQRAFELIEAVVAEYKTTAVAETMAMALAELGEFRGAAEWQRLAMDVARDAGQQGLAQQMSANLVLYNRGEPCRTPWRDDEPEHRPGLGVESGLFGTEPPL